MYSHIIIILCQLHRSVRDTSKLSNNIISRSPPEVHDAGRAHTILCIILYTVVMVILYYFIQSLNKHENIYYIPNTYNMVFVIWVQLNKYVTCIIILSRVICNKKWKFSVKKCANCALLPICVLWLLLSSEKKRVVKNIKYILIPCSGNKHVVQLVHILNYLENWVWVKL